MIIVSASYLRLVWKCVLTLGHGLFLESNDVIQWKWTLKENALVNNLSESTLLLLPLLFHFIHSLFHFSVHMSLVSTRLLTMSLSIPFFFVCLSSSFSPTHRPSCGGTVPCTRPQPETGSPEGDAEYWSRIGPWSGWFPPQWRCYSTQGLPGRAARTSAHTQTLSRSPEDWRWLLTLTHALLTLRLLTLLFNWPSPYFLLIFDMFCSELTLFDEKGDKTNTPDKDRQIEAFQLLFMLLPAANRSLLKLLLDLLHHTARNQHVNKMSAINLATMFAPHIIWPKNVRSTDAPFFFSAFQLWL